MHPTQQNQQTLRTITDHNTFGTTLLTLAMDEFGSEVLTWAPETVQMEMAETFGELPPANFDRLMAAIAILTTDRFFKEASAFGHLCNVLCGDSFQPNVFSPPSVVDCAWGITEALLLDPVTPEDPKPFSEDVTNYIVALMEAEGMVQPPQVIKFVVGDTSNGARDQWVDDPEMSAAIWGVQSQKAQEVDAVVHENANALFAQIKSLHLKNRKPQT